MLVENVNGYTLREDGRLLRFNAHAGSATTAGCEQLYERGDRRPRAAPLPAQRPRPHADPRPDRRPRPCHGPRHGRALARPLRHQFARRGAAADRRLRRRQPDPALDRRPRLEPGALGPRPLPDRRRSRRHRRRPAGLAGAGRRPCRLGQQRGDARGRDHRRRARRPQGGRIERTGRNPNGIFVDAAMPLVERAIPPPLPVQRDRAFARAQEILLSNGLTTVADMGTSAEDWAVMRRAGDAGRLQRPHPLLRLGHRQSARRRRHPADALALRRAAAHGRGEALSRRRAGLARRLAEGALSRRARPARPAAGQRHRAQESDEPGGDGQFPGRGPRHRRPGQCRCCSTRSTSSPRPMEATGAGGSSMPRSSIRPICRASPATASSPRCSPPTRPATG